MQNMLHEQCNACPALCRAATFAIHENVLGQLRLIFMALRQQPDAFDLSRFMPWTVLISLWTHPFRQHDVAEFVQHQDNGRLGVLRPGSIVLLSLAQLAVPFRLFCRGLHHCSTALTSGIPSQSSSALHAFTPDACVVILQLMRCNAVERGKYKRTVKDSSAVNGILDDILPVFNDASTLSCSHYAI